MSVISSTCVYGRFLSSGLWKWEDIDKILGNHGVIVARRAGSNPDQFVFKLVHIATLELKDFNFWMRHLSLIKYTAFSLENEFVGGGGGGSPAFCRHCSKSASAAAAKSGKKRQALLDIKVRTEF